MGGWLKLRRIRVSSSKLKKIRRGSVIFVFLITGPLVIIFFRLPGDRPLHPPILTISCEAQRPLYLTIKITNNFETEVSVSLSSLENESWEHLDILFPNDATDIAIDGGGKTLSFTPADNLMFKKYGEGKPSHLHIRRTVLDSILRKNYTNNPYSQSISFKIKDAVVNHSFSNKSLVMFYLWRSVGKTVDYQTKVGLKTPMEMVLNSSVPSPERILLLDSELNYDFSVNTMDSGLLFNFTDNNKAIFEEIALFIISSIFGFFSGLLIEQLLKPRRSP